MKSGRQPGLGACASDGTVIAAVASGIYVASLLNFAKSATIFGFQCIATVPYDRAHVHELRSPDVYTLPIPEPELLPRAQWCNSSLYGWRRTHLYKMHLWRVVIEVTSTLVLLHTALPLSSLSCRLVTTFLASMQTI